MFGIPVEFVPEGVSAEEARRQQAQRRGLSKGQAVQGLLALAALILLVAAPAWWFLGRNSDPLLAQESTKKPAPTMTMVPSLTITPAQNTDIQPTAALTNPLPRLSLLESLEPKAVVDLRQTSPIPTPQPYLLLIASLGLTNTLSYSEALSWLQGLPQPAIDELPTTLDLIASLGLTRTHSLTEALSLIRTSSYTDVLALVDVISALDQATPQPTITPTLAMSPTATPFPYQYQVIYTETHQSDLYSYVSGWIVEADGQTPRPAAIRLKYPDGVLEYPRPNHNDVATGWYEFMATPGEYDLIVGDLVYPVVVQDGQRIEISVRYTGQSQLDSPAISQPWGGHGQPAPTPQPARASQPTATPIPTPTPTATSRPRLDRHLFLPLILARDWPDQSLYLPLIMANFSPDQEVYLPALFKAD